MTLNETSNTLHRSYKELSIQVSLSGLSFCILDTSGNKIESLDKIELDAPVHPEGLIQHLDSWFGKEKVKQIDFDKIIAIHENELSSVVPKPLFNESNLSDYLKYNIKILENDYINYDELQEHDIYNVYIPFANVNNYLFEKFGDFEYKHFSTILIETIINNAKKGDPPTMYVYVNKGHFEIVVTDQKKLLLYNSFVYQQKEDFIYYLLFTIEQLNLNPEKVPTYLLGRITEDSELFKIAYKYIQHLKIGNELSPFKIHNKQLSAQEHVESMILLNSF